MKKRMMASLLCLCLILTCLPAAALAADYGNPDLPQLGLGTREEVVADTYYLLDAAGSLTAGSEDAYNLYFEDDSKTLHLKNAALKSSLYVPGGTTIELDGENSIENAGTGIQAQTAGGVTIGGTGSLEITSTTEGVLVRRDSTGDIVVKGSASLTLHAAAYGISNNGGGSILIEENAAVTSTGSQPAISAENIVISDNAVVSVQSSISADAVLRIAGKAVVTATDTLYGDTGIEILDQADVTVTSRTAGLNAFRGPIEIDGTVSILSTGAGNGAITVGQDDLDSDCTITIRGTAVLSAYNGLLNSAGGDVVVDGGILKVQSSSEAFPDVIPAVSPTRGIMMPFGGEVEIRNGAEVQMEVSAYGIYSMDLEGGTMQIHVSDSNLQIQSGEAGIAPASSAVSLTDSTLTVVGQKTGAFAQVPALHYADGYVIYAGADAASAAQIALDQFQTDANYVRIEPLPAAVEWGTDGESYPNAGTFSELIAALQAQGTDALYARLNRDIQMECVGGVGADKTLVLDLAGHTLRAKEGERVFAVSGDLVLNDSSGDNSGQLTGGSAAHNSGGAAIIYSGGTFTMNGGTITGNQDSAVRVMGDATFYLNGGVITGNTAEGYSPGGVDSTWGKTILSGHAVIAGNTNADGASNLRVNTADGETFAVGDAGLAADARIGISCNSTDAALGYTVLSDPFEAGKATVDHFTSDSAAHIVRLIETDAGVQLIRCKPQTAAPAATPAAGTYSGGRKVELSSATAGAQIYYTTDGSDPTTSATAQRYSSPITVSKTTTILAYACQLGAIDASETVRLEYTIKSSSGGSGTPSYPPVIEDTAHGSVSVNPKTPEQGDEVTITPKPDAGYSVEQMLVKDQNGKELDVERHQDGTYTFLQPKGKVTIEATFTESASGREDNCPSAAFADVNAAAWYHEAVDYAIVNGLMDGYSAAAFGPDDTLTRAMMVQILWNLEERPVVNYAMSYADVDADAWYAEAVRWASSERIVTGYSETAFGPADPITREQAALILYRYAQSQNYDTTEGGMAIREYADYDSISAWALSAMDWAVSAQLIDGRGNSLLSPAGSATRAEIAQILMNYIKTSNQFG